jgi:DNA-directed RNA polymerase specialized sigma24 family protein
MRPESERTPVHGRRPQRPFVHCRTKMARSRTRSRSSHFRMACLDQSCGSQLLAMAVPDDAAPSPLKDRRVILAFAAGDESAADIVIRAAAPMVRARVSIVRDAFWQADLTQDVLASMLVQRTRFAVVDDAESFIGRMAINRALTFLRRRWRFDADAESAADVPDAGPGPESVLRHRELVEVIDEYRNSLTEHDGAMLDDLLTGRGIMQTKTKFSVTQWHVRKVKDEFLAFVSAHLGQGMGSS